MDRQPKADWTGYGAIIVLSVVLCGAWLFTGNFWLTVAVLVLGLLHVARDFPAAEAVIADDPLLLWLRRVSPVIVLGIFVSVLLLNWMR
jgi:hypothetical protein